jgi:hypothetical protein
MLSFFFSREEEMREKIKTPTGAHTEGRAEGMKKRREKG